MTMKALVIGGSGFIGRNIIELLNKKKYYTTSYDIANIEKARKELQFEPEYDIRAGVKKMLE